MITVKELLEQADLMDQYESELAEGTKTMADIEAMMDAKRGGGKKPAAKKPAKKLSKPKWPKMELDMLHSDLADLVKLNAAEKKEPLFGAKAASHKALQGDMGVRKTYQNFAKAFNAANEGSFELDPIGAHKVAALYFSTKAVGKAVLKKAIEKHILDV